MKKLSVVIPAYNEEQAIRAIIEKTLAARERLRSEAGLEELEVIVVNDGSKDATAKIAGEYSEKKLIQLISYPDNRGYGAAIQRGFESATGNLLGFLDADGTCDPLSFIDLMKGMEEAGADIIVGARLNPGSEMPLTRKIGNIFYRHIVNVISNSKVTDIASGMRIIKKEALPKLKPLPDGLHFTPAMSVRAILDKGIRIAEIPIRYKERTGRSKLNVIGDGVRFLKTILEISFTYKPLRIFGFVGGLFLFIGFLYGLNPLLHYFRFWNVPEDRIYRLIFIVVAVVSGIQLILAGLITQAITNLVHNYEFESVIAKFLDRTFYKKLLFFGIFFMVAALFLNHQTILEYAKTRHISVHWSYVVTGALLILMSLQFITFSIISRVIIILKEKKRLESEASPS